ncbi:MAG: hypothetical protein ACRYF9_26060 [Janthinobacterium lividum]
MIVGQPLPDPRTAVIRELSSQIDSFFAAGGRMQHIAPGASSETCGAGMASHQQKLRAERDKLAPTAHYLFEQGKTLHEAAEAMGIATKRMKLIAKENGIKFPATT